MNLGSEVSDDLDVIPKIRSFRSAGLGWLMEGFADKRVTDEEVNLQGMDLVPEAYLGQEIREIYQ